MNEKELDKNLIDNWDYLNNNQKQILISLGIFPNNKYSNIKIENKVNIKFH
jgi:hypothetical protein